MKISNWGLVVAIASTAACQSPGAASGVSPTASEPQTSTEQIAPAGNGEFRVTRLGRDFAGARVDNLNPIEQSKDLRPGSYFATLWTHRDPQGRCFPAMRYDNNADQEGGDVTNFVFEAKELENWGWIETLSEMGKTAAVLGPVCGRESNEILLMQSVSGGLVWSQINKLTKPDGPNSRYGGMGIQGERWYVAFVVDEPGGPMEHTFRSDDDGKSWRFDGKRPRD